MKTSWKDELLRPWIIAGPCSAESFDQLYHTTKAIYELGINTIRSGIWKPRTRPNSFEGIGQKALEWIEKIKKELPVQFAVEVATAQHAELALKHGIDILWIGARTTVNPFLVQDIADSLRGTSTPVLIKNPVNPDLDLWIGCIERIANAGITKIGAIHRGFSSFKKTQYRNEPLWQLAIELKRILPHIPLICDPSHIGGDSSMIFSISQKALDLNYDGLIIETHPNPKEALSDPKQQVTPEQLALIINSLKLRKDKCDSVSFKNKLEELRHKIDSIDHDIIENLANRMKVIDEIGEYKLKNEVTILQLERWNEILKSRKSWAKDLKLTPNFVEEVYKTVHSDSIRRQTEIFNKNKN